MRSEKRASPPRLRGTKRKRDSDDDGVLFMGKTGVPRTGAGSCVGQVRLLQWKQQAEEDPCRA